MKKVKAYIKVIDELDIVEGILKLISYKPEDKEKAIVRFPVEQMEYEDEEHKFIYAGDIISKTLQTLGFEKCSWDNNYFIRSNVYICYSKMQFGDNKYYIVIGRDYELESRDLALLSGGGE